MKKTSLKSKVDIAREMYEASHEIMLELIIHNEYLKTDTAKEWNGSEEAKSLREKNARTIESHVNKLAFLTGFIEKEEKKEKKKK